MATTTNFGWTTPDDTSLVKDGAAAIRSLGSSIDSSMADLKGGTSGQVLAKNSNTDMDFTWTAIDPLVILDAKGDLITATAADTPARLPVGTNGQYLSANSSASTGLEWVTAAASGLTLISSNTLGTATQTVSFTSIPGTYKALRLLVVGRTNRSGANADLRLRFNGDTTANNYQRVGQGGNAGNAGGDWGDVIPYSAFTQAPLNIEIVIPQYAGTTFRKDATYNMTYQSSANVTPSGTPNFSAGVGGYRWDSSAAITQIDVTDANSTFVIGSTFLLYGMA